jgi:hypothetical protein
MKLLIVVAVAAMTAIIATVLIKTLDITWLEESEIQTAVVGGVSGVVAVIVSGKLRKDR